MADLRELYEATKQGDALAARTLIGLMFWSVNESPEKRWWSLRVQKMAAAETAHVLLQRFGDKLTPRQCLDLAVELNNLIYNELATKAQT